MLRELLEISCLRDICLSTALLLYIDIKLIIYIILIEIQSTEMYQL